MDESRRFEARHNFCTSVVNENIMESITNGEHNDEIQEEFSFHNERMASIRRDEYIAEIEEMEEMSGSSNGKRLMDFIPIYIPTIEKGLMPKTHRERRFLDFLKARPTNNWFLKFGFIRRARRRRANQADDSSPSDPSPSDPAPGRPGRRRFRVQFVRKINWTALFQYCKEWMLTPANVAFFIWLVLCAIGIVGVFLFMVGALNEVMPNKKERNKWEEIINQILNALFTMMCIYQHPLIFHHLVLVLRWRQDDRVAARSAYSKNGLPRPHDRMHILFVVILLHLTCAAQYAYCALYWGWSRKNRPEWPEYVLIAIGTVAPALAGLYTYYGPLAKNTPDSVRSEESQTQANGTVQSPEAEVRLYHRRVVVTSPEWIGGLFDCWDDTTVCCLSFFCTSCVFGWNMERLGFGNMYVHIFTFLMLCVSPFCVFNISAINVHDDTARLVVAISGAVFCVLGLLYGGYWRSEIRKKFKLPGNPFCCGYPLITDYLQWLFCWSCVLAQEVRTANFYDIEDNGFYRKVTDDEGRRILVPLPRESNMWNLNSPRSLSCPPKFEDIYGVRSPREMSGGCSPIELSITLGRASTYSKVHAMNPPLPPVMQGENE